MKNKYIFWIDSNKEQLIEISDEIWKFAEIGLEEYESSKLLIKTLKSAGFRIQSGVADMPTAFIASYGVGKPIIAILGEYDALPGLSQIAEPVKKPLKEGAPGHGCGHNLLGAGSLSAVLAVKEAIDAGDANGTIRYYGCPAEEKFNSKGYMIKPGGLFDDVDIALTWHPAYLNAVVTITALCLNYVFFKFNGRTAHASVDPFNGRSALDAVELMNVGANYMREHIIPDARLHYVITNGGKAPNVVPDEAEVYYYIRAPERYQVEEIYERLIKVAEGAALMTETTFEIEFIGGVYNLIHNEVITEVLAEKLKEAHPPKFNKEEQEFAKEIKKTLPPHSLHQYKKLIPPKFLDLAMQVLSQPLCPPIVFPNPGKGVVFPGSSDVGDVSWYVPLGQFGTACHIMGSPDHSWQNVATSGMSIGHKGMLSAAKTLALTTIEFMNNPDLVEKAQKEFKEVTKDKPYKSPFPESYQIPFERLKKHLTV